MTKIQQRLLASSILLAGFGMFFPLYKQLHKLYTQSSQEHLKTGFEIPAEVKDDSLNKQIEPKKQPPQELANNAEVIMVSGYEPDRDSSLSKVKVNVDRPGKNVLLVLSSYDQVNWEVEASPTTNITGVVISSYHPSTVTNIDSTKVFPVELPYSYEIENKNFVEALKQLNCWFGIDKVDALGGDYSLPNEIEISQLDSITPAHTLAGYPVEKPLDNFQFNLYNSNYEPVKWTSKGAINKSNSTISQTGIAISPDGREIYQLIDDGIKVTDRETGEQEDFKLPRKFPQLSWGTDIAYDSKRDLVSLISLGGEGYFYRFDVNKRRWLDVRSVNNIDLQSLTYDPASDRYIAWAEDYGQGHQGQLLFISGTGELLSQERVSDRLKGFYRQYDRNNGRSPVVEIIARGNNIVLLTRSGNSVRSIWHYDEDSKTVRLTYKSN